MITWLECRILASSFLVFSFFHYLGMINSIIRYFLVELLTYCTCLPVTINRVTLTFSKSMLRVEGIKILAPPLDVDKRWKSPYIIEVDDLFLELSFWDTFYWLFQTDFALLVVKTVRIHGATIVVELFEDCVTGVSYVNLALIGVVPGGSDSSETGRPVSASSSAPPAGSQSATSPAPSSTTPLRSPLPASSRPASSASASTSPTRSPQPTLPTSMRSPQPAPSSTFPIVRPPPLTISPIQSSATPSPQRQQSPGTREYPPSGNASTNPSTPVRGDLSSLTDFCSTPTASSYQSPALFVSNKLSSMLGTVVDAVTTNLGSFNIRRSNYVTSEGSRSGWMSAIKGSFSQAYQNAKDSVGQSIRLQIESLHERMFGPEPDAEDWDIRVLGRWLAVTQLRVCFRNVLPAPLLHMERRPLAAPSFTIRLHENRNRIYKVDRYQVDAEALNFIELTMLVLIPILIESITWLFSKVSRRRSSFNSSTNSSSSASTQAAASGAGSASPRTYSTVSSGATAARAENSRSNRSYIIQQDHHSDDGDGGDDGDGFGSLVPPEEDDGSGVWHDVPSPPHSDPATPNSTASASAFGSATSTLNSSDTQSEECDTTASPSPIPFPALSRRWGSESSARGYASAEVSFDGPDGLPAAQQSRSFSSYSHTTQTEQDFEAIEKDNSYDLAVHAEAGVASMILIHRIVKRVMLSVLNEQTGKLLYAAIADWSAQDLDPDDPLIAPQTVFNPLFFDDL